MTGNNEALPQGNRLHNKPQYNHAKIKEADRSLFAIVVTIVGTHSGSNASRTRYQKKYVPLSEKILLLSTCFHISSIEDATPPHSPFSYVSQRIWMGANLKFPLHMKKSLRDRQTIFDPFTVNVRESCDTIESHKKSWPFFDFRFLFDGISVTPS